MTKLLKLTIINKMQQVSQERSSDDAIFNVSMNRKGILNKIMHFTGHASNHQICSTRL